MLVDSWGKYYHINAGRPLFVCVFFFFCTFFKRLWRKKMIKRSKRWFWLANGMQSTLSLGEIHNTHECKSHICPILEPLFFLGRCPLPMSVHPQMNVHLQKNAHQFLDPFLNSKNIKQLLICKSWSYFLPLLKVCGFISSLFLNTWNSLMG